VRGYQALLFSGPGSTTAFTVPNGTYTLTGGTDGSLTAQSFRDFVEGADLEGVDLICPAGLTTEQVKTTDLLTLLAENNYPTLLVCQAPPSGSALSGVVNGSRYLCSVGFQTTYDAGELRERVDDAAPLVATILSDRRVGLTLAALPEGPFSPRYTRDELHQLAASGHTVAYQSISKGAALWHVVTGDPTWPVSTFRAFQEVVRPTYEVLAGSLGNPLVDLDGLDARLSRAYEGVEGSRVLNFQIEQLGETLYADVWFQPHGEIQVIEARILLGNRETASPV
jgi:hypothetical protein